MADDQYGPAIIDHLRSVRLGNGYTAAVLIDAAGTEYLMLVNAEGVGRTAVFDPTCATVSHEQLSEWRIPAPSEPTDLGHRVMNWPTAPTPKE
jgi:hypothetical protein